MRKKLFYFRHAAFAFPALTHPLSTLQGTKTAREKKRLLSLTSRVCPWIGDRQQITDQLIIKRTLPQLFQTNNVRQNAFKVAHLRPLQQNQRCLKIWLSVNHYQFLNKPFIKGKRVVVFLPVSINSRYGGVSSIS
jgi:hypothetical protein